MRQLTLAFSAWLCLLGHKTFLKVTTLPGPIMFQSFTSPHSSANNADRLSELRKLMREAGIEWFLVPHADEHQNEYLPPHAERLAFITGFTGSAGFALIGLENAWLFVDGRYTVQASKQTDASLFAICDLVAQPPSRFACEHISAGQTIGFDPWLITISQKKVWEKTAAKIKASLSTTDNLIDKVWVEFSTTPIRQGMASPGRICRAHSRRKTV